MNFKEYSQRFLHEQTPEGDLARDIRSDGGFPETKEFDEIESYLVYMNAAPEVMKVAERMFEMYREGVL